MGSRQASQPSVLSTICLLFLAAAPTVGYSLHKLDEVSREASEWLPEVSATDDSVGKWVGFAGFLFAVAVFTLAQSSKRKMPRWLWVVILPCIILGPLALVLILGLAFPSIYVPSRTLLLTLLGWGVMTLIVGWPFFIPLTSAGPWWGWRIGLVLAGLSLGVLLASPLRWFGEHWLQAKEVSQRQCYNEQTLRRAKELAERASRKAVAFGALIEDLESGVIPESDEPEPVSLVSRGPALCYDTLYATTYHTIDVKTVLKGLGPCRATPELEQLALLTDRQDFSERGIDLRTTLKLPCTPFHDFFLFYGGETFASLVDPGSYSEVQDFPEARDIRIVCRNVFVKNEIVGYYAPGPGITAEATTIKTEIITLPERKIVAERFFVGDPPYRAEAGLYEAGLRSLGGWGGAQKKAHRWLYSLYAEPNSVPAGE